MLDEVAGQGKNWRTMVLSIAKTLREQDPNLSQDKAFKQARQLVATARELIREDKRDG